MYKPIDKSKLLRKHGKPAAPQSYCVCYEMLGASYEELGRDRSKVKQRTKRSAAQFKARHLSSADSTAAMTVLDGLGMFVISSTDRKLLASLPQTFGSFDRGEVYAPQPKRPLRSGAG